MRKEPPRSPFYGRTVSSRDVSGFVLRELVYAPAALLPRHSHDTGYVAFLLAGSYREQVDSRASRLRPDIVFFRPAGDTHSNQFARSGARVFSIELTPAGVSRLRGHDVDLSKRADRRGGPAVRLGHRLFEQFRRPEGGSTLAMEGLIFEILSELVVPEQTSTNLGHFPWMDKLLAFLRASYREPVPLAKAARAAGVHPVHLARSFRRTHGQTLGGYVRGLRIEEACRKLITTDLGISEVALECGFADQSHFARVFRDHIGVSPGRFRKAHRR